VHEHSKPFCMWLLNKCVDVELLAPVHLLNLIGAVVCLLAAYLGSSCSLMRAMDAMGHSVLQYY